jgi:hypothetical protein
MKKDPEWRAMFAWSAENEMPKIWSGSRGLTFVYGDLDTGDELSIEFRSRTGGILANLKCREKPGKFPLSVVEEYLCMVGPSLYAYVPNAEKMTELLEWFQKNRQSVKAKEKEA